MNAKAVTIAVPTFKKLREAKQAGFDIADLQTFNQSYFKCLQDEESLKQLCRIIFNEELTLEEIDNIDPNVVWDGLLAFFGKCNVRIAS